MSRNWRKKCGLECCDIYQAAIDCMVCPESSPTSGTILLFNAEIQRFILLFPEIQCAICLPVNSRPLSIGIKAHIPTYDEKTGLETFKLSVKSICSSSR